MFVYNFPYQERKHLCHVLDQDDKWQELAERMGYDVITIANIEQKASSFWGNISPTEELLSIWEKQCHTILELFILLQSIHHYQAMKILLPHVDSSYHFMMNERQNLNLYN